MESHRLPRFRRGSVTTPIQLTQRDHAIIRQVQRHRFLRSWQIIALAGGSPQQILRRLKLLYHHGYLERPRAQLDYYHQSGSRHIVYGLGNKSRAVLKPEPGFGFHQSRWSEKNRYAGRMFLEHALLVSDVMVTIELACRKDGGVRLLHEDQLEMKAKDKPLQWKVKVQGGMKLTVVPDRVFALEYQGQSGRSQRVYFFLEADRGTMPVVRRTLSQTSFRRKLIAYEATWTQNLHHSKLGIHRFRVLTVTTSAGRIKSFINARSQLKRGHGLFLFADRTILDKPAEIFAPVWQTGRPGEIMGILS
jgi:Replication-relaxation